MTKQQKEDVSELKVAAALRAKGYIVSFPHGKARYDLLVDDGESIDRVQVKTCWLKNDSKIKFKTASVYSNTKENKEKSYDKNEIDYFIAHSDYTGDLYKVDVEEAPDTQMSLRLEPTKNNQSKGVNFAKDYKL